MPAPLSAVGVFYAVRDLPYAIDGAHDAAELLQLGSGDCLAKSDLLSRQLAALGMTTRLVRWRYELPAVVPAVETLPSRIDVHRAVQVLVDDRWLLVDPTHDAALASGGLMVAEWAGATDTAPAYPFLSPILIEGKHDEQIDRALAEVQQWTSRCEPNSLMSWRTSYINWLTNIRRG